jgi:Uma2 family endonuclease
VSVSTTKKLLTAEEFFDFVQRPENADRCFELVGGEVIEVSRPTKPHGLVCTRVGRILDTYAEQRGSGYAVSNDTGVILARDPDTVRGPDVASYEDASTYAELHPKYGEAPPLLAVEILSPNDKHVKVMQKVTDYFNAGVRLVWVLDPESREAVVHRLDKKAQTLKTADEITGEDVLPGFSCKVNDFFRLPGEKPSAPDATPAA